MLMGRVVSHKMEEEEEFDATRWLDRSLIRLCRWGRGRGWGGAAAVVEVAVWWGEGSGAATGWLDLDRSLHSADHPRPHLCAGQPAAAAVATAATTTAAHLVGWPTPPRLRAPRLPARRSRFGDYRKDDPESFQLRPQLSYYPQFMFNFRRSQFIQVGGRGGRGAVLGAAGCHPACVCAQPRAQPGHPGGRAARCGAAARGAEGRCTQERRWARRGAGAARHGHRDPAPRPRAPPSLAPLPAGVWPLAGRDRVCAHPAEPRGDGGRDAHDPAHPLRLLLHGPARAGAQTPAPPAPPALAPCNRCGQAAGAGAGRVPPDLLDPSATLSPATAQVSPLQVLLDVSSIAPDRILLQHLL